MQSHSGSVSRLSTENKVSGDNLGREGAKPTDAASGAEAISVEGNLGPVRQLLSDLHHQVELLSELVARDLKIRYMRSYLGMLWSLLTPLAQILIFSFLFRTVMPLGIENYTTFVFCGVLAWTWFSTSLISAASIVVSSPELVRRPGFPAIVLPLLSVLSNAIQFLIALPLLLLLSPIEGGTPGLSLLALPIVIFVQFLLTLAIAFPIASANVRFRDTQHIVALVTMAAFYLTPVFYSSDTVPERFQLMYSINPMVTILEAYRDVVIRGTWPDMTALAVVCIGSTLLLVVGYRVFVRTSAQFAEEL